MPELQKHISSMPLIAILRGIQPAEAVEMGEILIAGGITVIEVPLNSPEPFESIGLMCKAFEGRAVIGAGTVLKSADVDRLAKVGGKICVSPNVDKAVIKRALDNGIEPFPGVFTPTEAFKAVDAGARNLKLYPGGVTGPDHYKAIRDVLPDDVKIYAVGGISANNLSAWFQAGISGVGVGGSLYKAGQSLDDMRRKTSELVNADKKASL